MDGITARRSREFDLAKQVRLIPKFREEEVDDYFQHFEINGDKHVVAEECMTSVVADSTKWEDIKGLCRALNGRLCWIRDSKVSNSQTV